MSLLKTIVITMGVFIAGLLLVEAMRLLILKHDITTYKQYWDTQSRQTADPESTLYVALGDSAAQGIGASQPDKGYVGLFAAHISQTLGHPVHVVNLSVSGAKIQDVLNDQLPRLKQMQLPNGSTVTIEIGANDLGDFEADNFNKWIDELFRQLPPQTIVADMPYFGGGRAKNLENRAVMASDIIHKTASQYKLRVAPLHETTKNNDNIWVYGADFFHPNNRGYMNWYKAFLDGLSQ